LNITMITVSRLYYYGARYYDPRTSVFLGVDPLSDQSPNISPFAYCSNNPIMLVDPDGRESYEINQESGKVKEIDKTKYFQEKGGSITTVKEGDKYNGSGKSVDQVSNSNGEKKYYSGGVLGQEQSSADFQMFSFGDNKEASDFYYFAAGSTDAEYSFGDLGKGGGVVGTDSQSGNTKMPGIFEKFYGPSLKMLSHSHNGSGGGPSKEVWENGHMEPGDLLNAFNSEYRNLPREVYDVPNRRIYSYDGNSILKPTRDSRPKGR